MKVLVEIPEDDLDVIKNLQKRGWANRHEIAIANGQPIPDDCEILTKEAYEDLCARASMSEQERWRKGL